MNPLYAPEKLVAVSPFGVTDVSDYLCLINTPQFQRLKYSTQLGLVKEVFPNATHTRLAHSIGVFMLTKSVAKKLQDRNFLEDEVQRRELAVAALLHHIGHPPYSHAVGYALAYLH